MMERGLDVGRIGKVVAAERVLVSGIGRNEGIHA